MSIPTSPRTDPERGPTPVANGEPSPDREADPLKILKVVTEYGSATDFGQPAAREGAINDGSHLRVRQHTTARRSAKYKFICAPDATYGSRTYRDGYCGDLKGRGLPY